MCEPHVVLGCNPLTRGSLNTAPDSRGSTAALFNLIGALNNTADKNSMTVLLFLSGSEQQT